MKPFPSDNPRVSACCGESVQEAKLQFVGITKPYFCNKCGELCDSLSKKEWEMGVTLTSQQEERHVSPSPQAGGCSPNTQNTADVPPVGLSRRDEFAKAALTGYCCKFGMQPFETLAVYSRIAADLTIADLDRTSPDHA